MKIKFVFFGTPQISVDVLDILKKEGLIPDLIVTAPDKPKGRGLKLTPTPVKVWAEQNKIPVLQPEKLNSEFASQLLNACPSAKRGRVNCQLFVVVAYGKILPKEILNIPPKGVINLHYSLLPKLRGASPVETAILENTNPTGVTTILLNEKMDEGPILMQKEVFFENWPLQKNEVFEKLNMIGGKLLAETINLLSIGEINPRQQNHEQASYTKKINKEDGLIDLNDDPGLNYRKFLAFSPWPGVYFFKAGKRIKITNAELKDNKFIIKRVIPEGKKEVEYKS